MKRATIAAALACGLIWAAGLKAQEATSVVSPEAKAQLDKMAAAYEKVEGFSVSGKFAAELDVAGQTTNEAKTFEASYAGPMRFRHEVKDEMLIGGTGSKVFVFSMGEKAFMQSELESGSMDVSAMPAPMPQILRAQNPALWMALAKGPVDELTRGAAKVSVVEDTQIDGTAYPTVAIEGSDGTTMILATDGTTNLLRRMTVDLKKVFEARGAPDVKTARLVVDYATTTLGFPAGTSFDWTPPEGATDLAAAQGPAGATPQAAPAAALEGQTAPEFTLKDEAGNDVSLANFKGSVVVLDFWATWCPPCVEGLPALEAMAKERDGKGLKVLAVNVQEDGTTVSRFKERTNLGLPVVFDSDGKVSGLYKVTGIPQTVVIDRKGVVQKVLVGFGPGTKAQLAAAVDAALAAQ